MTLIEEARDTTNKVKSQSDRLLERVKRDVLQHSKLGHNAAYYNWQSLTYLFIDVLRESDDLSELYKTEIGSWQFQSLLRKLHDVAVAEGFTVETTFTDYMDIELRVKW